MDEKADMNTMAQVDGAPTGQHDETPQKQEKDSVQQSEQQKQEPQQQQQQQKSDGQEEKSSGPEGGYSSTPIPKPPPGTVGYTLKITIHRAVNLAMGDMQTLSSDPYVLAQLNTDLQMRHKEDPYLRFRTFTVRRTTDPEWNENWIVANVPSSGFRLKLRVYDEDPADHDDLLGKVWINVDSINDNWSGIKEETHKLSVAQSSKRALMVRSIAACFRVVPRHLSGELTVSIENLGRTAEDGQSGRLYTVGECRWFRHHSPILGRLTHTKDTPDSDKQQQQQQQQQAAAQARKRSDSQNKKIEHYNFQANQMQLEGPVPAELYHRFVEFKPWVKRMFTTSGIQGLLLGKALHHQHTRVYNFGRSTVWGHFPEGPSEEMTRKFLELIHYDQGGRIFTYVLTLDSLWRFTETGKEFGIDMLSKHTMHSDVSIYIAFSGEFFVRRLKHRHRPNPPNPTESTSQQTAPAHAENESHPPDPVDGGPPDDDPPKDPAYYELFIDNDSGTYRPNAAKLPQLAAFLARSLPGLHIRTLDCQADADKMAKLKTQQRERKRAEGENIVYTQESHHNDHGPEGEGNNDDGDASSISSSDEEELDAVQAELREQQRQQGSSGAGGEASAKAEAVEARRRRDREDFATGTGRDKERGTTKAVAKDVKQRHAARWDKVKREYGRARDDDDVQEGNVGQEVTGQIDGEQKVVSGE